MQSEWIGVIEAFAAGIGGSATLLIVVVWFFSDKFYNWVELSFDKRGAAIKEKIDKLYAEDISRREEWIEEVRRNQHSIEGLTEIMTEHEEKLKALQDVPLLMRQQITLMSEVKRELKHNGEAVQSHSIELARLIERRNQTHGG